MTMNHVYDLDVASLTYEYIDRLDTVTTAFSEFLLFHLRCQL